MLDRTAGRDGEDPWSLTLGLGAAAGSTQCPGQFAAARDVELSVDVCEVHLDCLHGHEQGLGDLALDAPSAAMSAMRRSLGVIDSAPVSRWRRIRSPDAASSWRACSASASAPQRLARS